MMGPRKAITKRLAKVALSCAFHAVAVIPRSLAGLLWGRGGKKIVLAYHGVSDLEVDAFAAQMDQLLEAGKAVPLEGEPSIGTCNDLCVTFDDALASVCRNALPILEQRRIPAVIFVPSGNIGKRPKWKVDEDFKYKDYRVMTFEELAGLDPMLVGIGSHTVTHGDLTMLCDQDALAELAVSKAWLEGALAHKVEAIAFPYGSCNRRVVALAEKAGYRHAYSIEPLSAGKRSRAFLSGRVRMEPDDWRVETWLKLRGAYQWLGYAKKACRRVSSGHRTDKEGTGTPPRQPGNTFDRECPLREDVQLSVAEPADRDEWSAALALFDDASIYQAWDYPNVVYPKQQTKRLIFRRGEELVAMAQARILTVPLLKRGIAHIAWGPLWRRKDRADGNGLLRPVLESMRQEFASKMKLLLRVVPNVAMEESVEILSMLAEAGFTRKASAKPYVTSVIDLIQPLEAIRKALHQKWRNCLNRAERNGLHYTEGSGDHDYRRFLKAYRALSDRKQFETNVDAQWWALLQKALPGKEKMRIFLAYHQGRVTAGAVISALGETGIYLLGATTAEGLKLKASYLLQWKVIEYLKSCGIARYDLGGIDPVGNPGVYRFKSRMGGKEVPFLGTFECCESRISRAVVQSGQTLRRLKASLSRRRAS